VTKADLRSERAVVVRLESWEGAEESRAFCWNWKGLGFLVGAGAVAEENMVGVTMLVFWFALVVMDSLPRNGWFRCGRAGAADDDGCALVSCWCIEFSSGVSGPLCFVLESVMNGCRLWALAWLARSGLGDLGWKVDQAAKGFVR